MARSAPVRLDHRGIGQQLKSSEMGEVVEATAETIAENVRSQGLTVESGAALPVEVDTYTTDRSAASVMLAHAAGLGVQAKYGALTKAASASGLEVKGQ